MSTIVVGVSGGIAAYKSAELVRELKQQHHQVVVAMTEAATRFITPLTLGALSGQACLTNLWDMSNAGGVRHVEIGHQAEAIVIAPATADLIAKLAAGLADDVICGLVLSSTCPVLLAPAMETNMWNAATTQRNLATLIQSGRFSVIGPDSGGLASGHVGVGRMSEPPMIAAATRRLLKKQDLAGKRVLVSAGPTREPMDPVRFITNRSSGKMGFALAEQAALRGADVTLVAGPVSLLTPPFCARVDVNSAQEMLTALEARVSDTDILLMAAAVCDYAPKEIATSKLKKAQLGATPSMTLQETPDLLKSLKPKKRGLFIGFAAETTDVEMHARQKLSSKGLDLIVANDVSRTDIGFDSDFNQANVYDASGLRVSIERADKATVADRILDDALRLQSQPR